MNPTKRIKETPPHGQQQKRDLFHISDDCLGHVLKFLSVYTLFRTLCVSSVFNQNVQKTLSKVAELPTTFEFSALQKVRSIKKHCRGLQFLHLLNTGTECSQSKMEDLAVSLPGLRVISLRIQFLMTSQTDQFLTNISLMLPKLESLRFVGSGNLSLNLLQCKDLQRLDIFRAAISKKDMALFLNQTPSLKKLRLSNLYPGLHFTDMFTGVGTLQNLMVIELSAGRTMINFRTAQNIVKVMQNLETVSLRTCSFGVPGLLELLKLAKLNELRISCANLEDFPSGVVKLSMKVFGAAWCCLQDGCIGRIARAFPNLEELNVSGNHKVTQNAMKQLDVLKLTELYYTYR